MSGYIEAKNHILDFINENKLKPGDQLPTEIELAEKIGVSRLTLREALNALKNEGIIHSTQGRGTFLSCRCDQIRDVLNTCLSITRMISDSGFQAGTSVFERSIVEADEIVARKLDIPTGAGVVCCTRVRLADGKPVGYTKDFLAPKLTPQFLSTTPTEDFSMDRFLKEECKIELGVSLTEMIPIVATEFLADCLEVELGQPLMLLQDFVQDVYGNPLIYAEEILSADAFHFIVKRFN